MKNVKNRFLVLLTLLFSDYCQDIKISAKQNSSKRIFGRLAKTRKSKINQKQI